MSRLAQRRRAVRWARYFNRYASIETVQVSGWAAVAAMNTLGRGWVYVRRQAKRKYGEAK